MSNRCFLYFAFKTQGSDKNAFFFFWQPSIYEKAFYKVITGEIIMFWVRGQPIKRLPGNWPFPGTGRVDAQVRGGPPCSGFREGDALGARPPSNPDPSGDTQPLSRCRLIVLLAVVSPGCPPPPHPTVQDPPWSSQPVLPSALRLPPSRSFIREQCFRCFFRDDKWTNCGFELAGGLRSAQMLEVCKKTLERD